MDHKPEPATPSQFFIAGMVLGAFLNGLFVTVVLNYNWRSDLAERGYAQYCPIDGRWAWKDECN